MIFRRARHLDCGASRPLLSAHIDGRLTSAEERLLRAHLADCAACREELRTLELAVNAMRRLPNHQVPRSFAVPAAIRGHDRPSLFYVLRAATAAVAAMFFVSVAYAYLLPVQSKMSSGEASRQSIQAVRTDVAQDESFNKSTPSNKIPSTAPVPPSSDTVAPSALEAPAAASQKVQPNQPAPAAGSAAPSGGTSLSSSGTQQAPQRSSANPAALPQPTSAALTPSDVTATPGATPGTTPAATPTASAVTGAPANTLQAPASDDWPRQAVLGLGALTVFMVIATLLAAKLGTRRFRY